MNRPKGTKDIFNDNKRKKDFIMSIIKKLAQKYGYDFIDTPVFEAKPVFSRSVGATSDIVAKEMYEFKDKKGRELVLKPEGTASVVRAVVENKLYVDKDVLRLAYFMDLFRYERPQKGRQRQFFSFGVETFSQKSPLIDAEVILLAARILNKLNIDYILKINSLGDIDTRTQYSLALKKYFAKFKDQLEPTSIMRLENNPLRILDDKIENKKEFVKNAPKISEFYSDEIKNYFEKVTTILSNSNIEYEIDEKLVRGLDYYTDTAFEFISISLEAGSQSTLIGGGRYDKLVEEFGGPQLSGVGFGLGFERLVNDYQTPKEFSKDVDVCILNIASQADAKIISLSEKIRNMGLTVAWNLKPKKINKLFEQSDKLNAKIKIIIGDKELSNNTVSIKSGEFKKSVDVKDFEEVLKKEFEWIK